MIRFNGAVGVNNFNRNGYVAGAAASAMYRGISAFAAFNGISASGAFTSVIGASGAFKGRTATSAVDCVQPCADDRISLANGMALLINDTAGVSVPAQKRLFHDLIRIT